MKQNYMSHSQVEPQHLFKDKWFWIITGIALLFRIGHFIALHADPVCNVPLLDSLSYDRLARMIAFGNGMPQKVYFQAPFYPYFLAVLYKISAGSYDLVRLVQLLLDILSTLLVFRISYDLFDRRTAIIAGIGTAVYPVLIFNTGLLLKTTLNVFFASLTLRLIFNPSENHKRIRILFIGLVTGWAAATQGSVLLQIPLLFVWIAVDCGLKHLKKSIIYAALLALGLILSIGPFTLRNYLVSQRFVLLTAQGGANFYLGNSPYSDGTSKRPPNVRITPEHEEDDFHREAERLAGRKLTPEEASGFWTREALNWIRNEPKAAAMLQLRKAGLFWNRVEIPDNYDFDFYRRYSPFIRFPRYPFWILGTLGLCGMVFLTSTFRRTWFLYLWTMSYSLIWIVFHIYSRYRLPVVVFIMPFAAAFTGWLYDAIRDRRWRKLSIAVLCMITIAGIHGLPLTNYSHAQPLFNLGTSLSRLGKPTEAAAAFKESLAVFPKYAPAMVNLGKLAWSEGDYPRAEKWWLSALEADPDSAEAHSNLGTYCAVSGRMADAQTHFSNTVAIQPYYLLGWLHLGQAEQALGNFPEAVQAYNRATDLEPDNAQAWFGKASSLESIDPDAALVSWRNYLKTAYNNPQERGYIRDAQAKVRQLESLLNGTNDQGLQDQ